MLFRAFYALPKKIVDQLPETDYFDVELREGEVVLKPVRVTAPSDRLRAIRGKMRRLGIGEEDVAKAVRWARRRA